MFNRNLKLKQQVNKLNALKCKTSMRNIDFSYAYLGKM